MMPALHNRQTNEHLDVLLFAEHNGALTENFGSLLFHVRNPHYCNSAGTYDDQGLTT